MTADKKDLTSSFNERDYAAFMVEGARVMRMLEIRRLCFSVPLAIVAILFLAVKTCQAAWILTCKDDLKQNIRTCDINGDVVTVTGMALQHGPKSEFVLVGYDYLPGSEVAFRIDKNNTIHWPSAEIVGRSKDVIEQMSKGRKLTSRYQRSPTGTVIQSTEDLDGFAKQLLEMRRRINAYAK